MRVLFFLFIFIRFATVAYSQEMVTGIWKTVDDQTGEAKSYVKVYEENGKLYGKITQILTAEQDVVCEACKGEKKNKPIRGMMIIDGLEKDGNEFEGGKILDPETGNTYKCRVWLSEEDQNILKVRGIHWTGLYRTQNWLRVVD